MVVTGLRKVTGRRTGIPVLVSGVVVALVACAIAGCSGSGERMAQPAAADSRPYPIVVLPQAQGILDAVDRAVESGVVARTAEAFGPRVIGPYRDIALAKGRVDAARKVKPVVPAVERRRLIVPTSTSWPRFFVAVCDVKGQATPALRVMLSQSARSQYGLWAELLMLPGATLPETAAATNGAQALASNATGLEMSPRQVVEAFARYLNSSGKEGADDFAPNEFSDQVIKRLANDRKAQAGAATVTSTHTPDVQSVFALRTADGGALVIGQMTQKYTVKVKSGRTVTVDPALGALAGGKTRFTKSFTRTATEVVAFGVPPRGTGPVNVIAAQKGDVSAVAA